MPSSASLIAGSLWSTYGQSATFLAGVEQGRHRLDQQLPMMMPVAERSLHIHGPVERASEGENLGWHWRFVPDAWDVVEASIEVCIR